MPIRAKKSQDGYLKSCICVVCFFSDQFVCQQARLDTVIDGLCILLIQCVSAGFYLFTSVYRVHRGAFYDALQFSNFCARACVRAWVHAWVCAGVHACAFACVRAGGRECGRVCAWVCVGMCMHAIHVRTSAFSFSREQDQKA